MIRTCLKFSRNDAPLRVAGMIPKFKILFLIDVLCGWGGTEKHLYQLISHLDKNHVKCFLCSFAATSEMMRDFQALGASTLLLPLERVYGITALKQGLRLAQFLRQNRIDIVQTFHFAADFLGSLAAKSARTPVIIASKRDMGFQNSRWHNFVLRRIQSFIDETICVSQAVNQALAAQKLLDKNKASVIYNGVDLSEFAVAHEELSEKKQELGFSAEDSVVAMVANPRAVKDLETFARAARRVIDMEPNVRFLVIGEFHQNSNTPSYREKLNHLTASLNLNGRFCFLGRRTDIKELLAIADVCVLTSLSEGFSNTLLEYMAAGKPVVVTAVGGNREAVIADETGFLVPPRCPGRTADSIITLLRNPHLAERMGRTAQKRIKDFFTLDVMVANYQSLYTQLLSQTLIKKT